MGRRVRAGHTTWLVVIAAALCLGAVSCGGSASPPPAANPPHVRSCTVQGLPARCGTLAVAENRLTAQAAR
jgi:hypothetical protein